MKKYIRKHTALVNKHIRWCHSHAVQIASFQATTSLIVLFSHVQGARALSMLSKTVQRALNLKIKISALNQWRLTARKLKEKAIVLNQWRLTVQKQNDSDRGTEIDCLVLKLCTASGPVGYPPCPIGFSKVFSSTPRESTFHNRYLKYSL